jgi:hypothetical protein
MRIFGYLGLGFLIVWLLTPATMPIAVAEPVQAVAPDITQLPLQPNLDVEEDLLNLLD